MRALVSKVEFLSELNTLRGVFGANEQWSNPSIYITGDKDKMTLVADDRMTKIVGVLNAKVVRDGSLMIKGASLQNLLKLLPPGELTLDTTETGWLALTIGDFSAKLPASPCAPRPASTTEFTNTFTLKASALDELIESTRFVIARSQSALAGVALLEIGGNAARMVATDGHRLALAETDSIAEDGVEHSLIISKNGLAHLHAVLSEQDGNAVLSFTDRVIHMAVGSRELSMQLVAQKFPAYRRIIPIESAMAAKVDKNALRAAIRRTTLMSASADDCSIELRVEPGQIVVEARDTSEGDQASEAVPCEVATDEPLPRRLRFNAGYVLSAIDTLDETILIKVMKDNNGALLPVRFVSEGSDSVVQVVMPRALVTQKEKNGKAA